MKTNSTRKHYNKPTNRERDALIADAWTHENEAETLGLLEGARSRKN